MASYGKQRFELVLYPVSGKAVLVYKGEVLRLTLLEGAQCIDFNCFNLHDYKEHMSVGHTRSRQGFRIKKGDVIMSNPNRFNPMLAIIEKPESCVTDLLGARCWAALYEMKYGYFANGGKHTNCQHTFAETIGEYGLTPDDVHDSFNMFMNTGWTDDGKYLVDDRRNTGKKDDYVDLLALMDVLTVPIVCSSGDVFHTSNFWLKPLKVEIFEPSDETKALTQEYIDRYDLKSRETVADFHIKEIRSERELTPISGYKPNFINYPLKIHEFTIELTDEDYKQVQRLKWRGLGVDDEDAIRSAVMEWCDTNNVRI